MIKSWAFAHGCTRLLDVGVVPHQDGVRAVCACLLCSLESAVQRRSHCLANEAQCSLLLLLVEIHRLSAAQHGWICPANSVEQVHERVIQ